MNKAWSDLNKLMQAQLKKEVTYKEGIETLFQLRRELFYVMESFREELKREDFDAIPFMGANGYHNKTIGYSLWHIFRIEDIVAHTLIQGDEQIFFVGNYQKRINAPIITTGNELVEQQIADFSSALSIDALYEYIEEVRNSTDEILMDLSYQDLKRKMTEKEREDLVSLRVVSEEEGVINLIDYWCGKDVRGLIQMPFSRHWIMHTEAALRIRDKIMK